MDLNELQMRFKDDMLCVRARIEDFPWHNPRAYALYMKQTEHFSGHTSIILDLVANKFPAGHEMHERFKAHTIEEAGHDLLAVRDVKNLGYNPEQLPVLSITRGFIQAQYYWLESVSPYSIFGWILLLETCAAEIAPGIVEKLDAVHGKHCCGFLRLHAYEDQDHVAKAWVMLEQCSSEELQCIWDNYRQSADNYLMIFEDIERGLSTLSRKVA